jgi:hypothetical protein
VTAKRNPGAVAAATGADRSSSNAVASTTSTTPAQIDRDLLRRVFGRTAPRRIKNLPVNWRRRPLPDCPWCRGWGDALANRFYDCQGREAKGGPVYISCACIQAPRPRGTTYGEFRARVVSLRDQMVDVDRLNAQLRRGRR